MIKRIGGMIGAVAIVMSVVGMDVLADQNVSSPVSCSQAGALKPIVFAENETKCPGGVYCNNPNTSCGEYCCPWGYFYSNGCTCQCYKSSYDAGADCSTYFRCQ